MPFFDTHTHLDYVAEDLALSIPQLVANAEQAGVSGLLIVAIFAKNFEKVTACAHKRQTI